MHEDLITIDAKVRSFMDRSLRGETNEADFKGLALELFTAQRKHNSAYAKFCSGEPKSWREIPSVPTVAFKELALTSLAPAERERVFYSSGTTQKDRSRHFHNQTSLGLYTKSLLTWFGAKFGNTFASADVLPLTPSTAEAPNSSLAFMFDAIAQRQDWENFSQVDDDGNWILDSKKAFNALESAQITNAPVALMGTAFLFVNLIDACAERGIRFKLPAGSWALETGGYKGRSREVPREELRRLVEERLGISSANIFSEYGMSELGSQGYDRADGIFHFPPWARAVLVSPATGKEVSEGERGLIRVFDLANVYSVMAVQTEDVGIKIGEGFKLAGRAPQAEARGCSLMTIS